MNKRQVYPGDYIHKDRRSVVDLRSYLDQKMFGVVTTPNVYTVFLYKEAGFLKFDEEWHIESKGSCLFFVLFPSLPLYEDVWSFFVVVPF